MLYDILAVLWGDAGTPREIALGVAARTGALPKPEVVDGHLWLLRQFGFVEAASPETAETYKLTNHGSALLALAATEQ